MHLGFQDVARDARDFGDVQHSLAQVSSVMNKCITCHSSYRLIVADKMTPLGCSCFFKKNRIFVELYRIRYVCHL